MPPAARGGSAAGLAPVRAAGGDPVVGAVMCESCSFRRGRDTQDRSSTVFDGRPERAGGRVGRRVSGPNAPASGPAPTIITHERDPGDSEQTPRHVRCRVFAGHARVPRTPFPRKQLRRVKSAGNPLEPTPKPRKNARLRGGEKYLPPISTLYINRLRTVPGARRPPRWPLDAFPPNVRDPELAGGRPARAQSTIRRRPSRSAAADARNDTRLPRAALRRVAGRFVRRPGHVPAARSPRRISERSASRCLPNQSAGRRSRAALLVPTGRLPPGESRTGRTGSPGPGRVH